MTRRDGHSALRVLRGKLERFDPHPVDRREVLAAEEYMREHGTPVEIPITHYFANKGTPDGLYGRKIVIPAGTLLTGHIHKKEQINVLASGLMRVSTATGFQTLRGPEVVVSPPGTKRIALAIEECIWISFHPTELTDVGEIEKYLTCQTEQEFLEHVRQLEAK